MATITERGSGEFFVCRLDDLEKTAARGFDPHPDTGEDRAFVVRYGKRIYAYVNRCPHSGRPLEYAKDRFLSGDGSEIICYTHGAHFDISDGRCIYGPCAGKSLRKLTVEIRDGWIWVALP